MIFVLTVDGVHCPIEEPTHNDFSNNKKFYSHRFHTAGLDYKLGISIFTQNCVWVAGPHLAGTPNITIFRAGLKQQIEAARDQSGFNHHVIGDRGYRGEWDFLSTPKSFDSKEL